MAYMPHTMAASCFYESSLKYNYVPIWYTVEATTIQPTINGAIGKWCRSTEWTEKLSQDIPLKNLKHVAVQWPEGGNCQKLLAWYVPIYFRHFTGCDFILKLKLTRHPIFNPLGLRQLTRVYFFYNIFSKLLNCPWHWNRGGQAIQAFGAMHAHTKLFGKGGGAEKMSSFPTGGATPAGWASKKINKKKTRPGYQKRSVVHWLTSNDKKKRSSLIKGVAFAPITSPPPLPPPPFRWTCNAWWASEVLTLTSDLVIGALLKVDEVSPSPPPPPYTSVA